MNKMKSTICRPKDKKAWCKGDVGQEEIYKLTQNSNMRTSKNVILRLILDTPISKKKFLDENSHANATRPKKSMGSSKTSLSFVYILDRT